MLQGRGALATAGEDVDATTRQSKTGGHTPSLCFAEGWDTLGRELLVASCQFSVLSEVLTTDN